MHILTWLFALKLIYAENSSEWNKKKRFSRPWGDGTVCYFFHTNVFEAYFVFKTRPLNSMLIYPRQSDFKDTSTITFGYCWNEGLTSRQCFIYNKTFVILYYKIILYNYVLNTLWNIPKLLRYVKIDQFTLFFF